VNGGPCLRGDGRLDFSGLPVPYHDLDGVGVVVHRGPACGYEPLAVGAERDRADRDAELPLQGLDRLAAGAVEDGHPASEAVVGGDGQQVAGGLQATPMMGA
jgi:hypothetical protein